jgi:hypothetical protein
MLVIATTGASPDQTLVALGGLAPANARVERFLPDGGLLPHVDVLVTNGGYGTVQQALAHGVRIVAAAATEEKPENAARIAWSGAGVRIRALSRAPDRIRGAVRVVLAQPRYGDRARAISREMGGYDAPRAGADLLERLAATRQAGHQGRTRVFRSAGIDSRLTRASNRPERPRDAEPTAPREPSARFRQARRGGSRRNPPRCRVVPEKSQGGASMRSGPLRGRIAACAKCPTQSRRRWPWTCCPTGAPGMKSASSNLSRPHCLMRAVVMSI